MSKSENKVSSESQLYGAELGSDMMDILVGPKKKLFRVHKQRLCEKAPVFDRMFNGGCKEALELRAELPEDGPRAFAFFVEWIYTDRIRGFGKSISVPKVKAADYVKVYCFADKYCLPQLMDLTISNLLAYMKSRNKVPKLETIRYAYTHTSSGSPLRFLAVRTVWYVVSNDGQGTYELQGLCDLLHESKDLTMDYLKLSQTARPQESVQNPRDTLNVCEFHVHGADEACSVKETLLVESAS